MHCYIRRKHTSLAQSLILLTSQGTWHDMLYRSLRAWRHFSVSSGESPPRENFQGRRKSRRIMFNNSVLATISVKSTVGYYFLCSSTITYPFWGIFVHFEIHQRVPLTSVFLIMKHITAVIGPTTNLSQFAPKSVAILLISYLFQTRSPDRVHMNKKKFYCITSFSRRSVYINTSPIFISCCQT